MTATVVKPTTTVVNPTATALVGADLQHEIEQFYFLEADLMDAWQLEEWLSLLAPDIQYWAPTQQNRTVRERGQELAAPGTAAYFDETWKLLRQRVDRMHTSMAWAEEPRSRIRHLICNVRVRPTDNYDEYEVDSSFYLFRTRMEREMDHFVGRRFDLLRRVPSEHGFQVARRKIILDMSTLLAKNISVFF